MTWGCPGGTVGAFQVISMMTVPVSPNGCAASGGWHLSVTEIQVVASDYDSPA